MNRIFNIIWSKSKERWIVVSEKVKSNGKVPKSLLLSFALLSAMMTAGVPLYALDPGTLPTGGQVTSGNAVIATSGNQMRVDQSSQSMIANWQSFNIGANAGVRFNQPNSSSTALNRITDQNPTQIMGSLSANGKLFLINPSGILFGSSARVDVGGLVASSLDMLDHDFLDGKYSFRNPGNAGTVLNQGTINTFQGGVVALIAPKATNEGTIATPGGSTALGAGNQVSLDFNGDGLISLTIDAGAVDALAENKGLIKAEGGLVMMSAKAADALIQSAVNNSGVIEAKSFEQRAGRIILDAAEGMTTISGTLDASSSGSKGGQIVATGNRVMVTTGAHLTASGATGGGEVLVGGSWQGMDSSIPQATGTIIQPGALLEANATDNGNGGTVVAWSDVTNPLSVTRAYGTFEAQGGPNGGDGGRIETSGHWIDVEGSQGGASATMGESGLWLFDPYDVTISNSTSGSGWSVTTPFIWTPTGTSTILNTDINTKLKTNSVTITTTSLIGADLGNITVSSPILKALNSNSPTLTLTADGSIIVNADIGNTIGTLKLILNANGGAISGTGNISVNGATIFNVGGIGASGTYSGIISNTSSFTKQGEGTLILSGANTYNGLTKISNGILAYGADNVLSSGAVTLNGGYFDIGTYSDSVGAVTVNSGHITGTTGVLTGASYTVDTIYFPEISAILGGTGGLTKLGIGTLTLSRDNTYTGATTINEGTLRISKITDGGVAGNLGASTSAASNLVLAGGTLKYTGTKASTDRSFTLTDGTTSTIDVINNLTISGSAANTTGALTKAGGGNLTLSGANSYTGLTTISAGTLLLGSTGALGTTDSGTIVNDGATLNLHGFTLGTAEALTLNGTGDTGAGALTNSSAKAATWSGLITLGSDSSIIAGSGMITQSNTINGNFGLSVHGSGSVTLGGTIGDTSPLASFTGDAATTLVINGGSIVTTGSQSYNGPTTFGAGTTLTTTDSDITATGAITATAGTLTFASGTGNVTFSNTLNNFSTVLVNGAGNVSLVDGNELTVSGITASGLIDVATLTGDLTISGDVSTTYSPLITFIATQPSIIFNAGKNEAAGTATGGNIIIAGSPTITAGPGGIGAFYTGSVSGSVGLTDLIGTGTGNFRYNSDESTTNYTTPLSAGLNAIYREQPTITITANSEVITYGEDPVLSTISTGFQNGDTPEQTFSGGVNVAVDGLQSSSNHYTAGLHTLTPSGENLLGYALSYATPGTLTVDKKALTMSGVKADNKIYDGNTNAFISSYGTLTGVIVNDAVGLDRGIVSAQFDTKNVGTGKNVTLGNLNLTGIDRDNYSIANQTTTANITAKALALTLIDLKADNKIYDGNKTATISSYGTLTGMIESEAVGLNTDSASAQFDNKNVGKGKTVTVSNLNLTGDNSGNYSIENQTTTADITAKLLALTGLTANNKVYDGNKTATISNYGTLTGVIGSDAVTLATASASAEFDNKNAGTGKTVTVSNLNLSGSDVGNYSIATEATTTATITAKPITISGLKAYDKNYDGNDKALVDITGVVFNGWITPDDLYLSASGTFNNPDIGNGKLVTLTTTYGGIDRNNYTITGQETTTASILSVESLAPIQPVVQSPIITSALGLVVEYRTAATETSNGVIFAVVPQAILDSGAMFTIPLPEDVQAAMATGTPDSITLEGGADLPNWLTYDPETRSFKVDGASSGSLATPVTVVVRIGGKSWTVEITSK